MIRYELAEKFAYPLSRECLIYIWVIVDHSVLVELFFLLELILDNKIYLYAICPIAPTRSAYRINLRHPILIDTSVYPFGSISSS